jgi:putative DNA primase/helicase
MTAAEIAARFGLKRNGRGWSGPCPSCGYKAGLRLGEKAGKPVWWCASCQDREGLTRAILGDAPPAAPAASRDDGADRRAAALRLWEAAWPASGSPAEVYLASRGLALPEGAPLRFLPDARHPSGVRAPAMLALLLDHEARPVAIHRTYLAAGGVGKANLDPPKATLGTVRGAAVRLYQGGPRLTLAEGIENALAAAKLLRLPAWAATSAGNLAELVLPPAALVPEVIIAADHDAPGLAAASAAAARFRREGRRVSIAKPDREGEDFCDVLRRRARGG